MSTYEEIQERIHALEESISNLTSTRRAATHQSEQILVDARAVRKEYEDRIEETIAALKVERDAKISEKLNGKIALDDAIAKANQEINFCRLELNRLNVDLARELEKKQMAQRLDEAEQSLKALAAETIWYKKAMPFQMEDITFTVSAFMSGLNGVLNANDMSLGKTLETAATHFILEKLFEMEHGRKPNCLWLTKKSLTDSNVREIRKWLGNSFTPVIVRGGPDTRRFAVELGLSANQMIVANHEAVRTTPILQAIKWDLVYIDEVHKLKGGANPKPTEVWVQTKKVCEKARFTIMLSGTPYVNAVSDMWSYLHIFAPERFPNVKRFNEEFTNPDGSVDFKRILNVLKAQCFRRTKAEVKDQLKKALGDKVREFYYFERDPEQDEVYQQAKSFLLTGFDSMDPNEKVGISAIIAQLTRLRQINVWPAGVKIKREDGSEMTIACQKSSKIDQCMDITEQLLAEGEQVVVYSAQFNEPLWEVQRRVRALGKTCEVLSGATVNRIGEFEQDFQEARIDVLCINSATGSEGLNLQKNPEEWKGGSSNAIFLDLWYAPGRNLQGEDRIWRFGSEETCYIHILQCESSVDAFIAAILEKKQGEMDGIFESEELRTPGQWKQYLQDLI